MVVLNADASDEDILSVARAWADLIALDDFASAQKLLAAGRWTPEAIRERLESFGHGCPRQESPSELFPDGDADGAGVPPSHVERSEGRVLLGLDLKDCPRGLTVEFHLRPAGDGLGLDLADIRRD